jgi:hypothetical protein
MESMREIFNVAAGVFTGRRRDKKQSSKQKTAASLIP